MSVRNNWAHCSADLPGKDMILHDLKTLSEFIGQIGGSQVTCREIDNFITYIEQPDSVPVPTYEAESADKEKGNYTEEKKPGEIHENSMVYLVASPETKGIVVSMKDLGTITQYEVFVNNTLQKFFSFLLISAAGIKSVSTASESLPLMILILLKYEIKYYCTYHKCIFI